MKTQRERKCRSRLPYLINVPVCACGGYACSDYKVSVILMVRILNHYAVIFSLTQHVHCMHLPSIYTSFFQSRFIPLLPVLSDRDGGGSSTSGIGVWK